MTKAKKCSRRSAPLSLGASGSSFLRVSKAAILAAQEPFAHRFCIIDVRDTHFVFHDISFVPQDVRSVSVSTCYRRRETQ